MTCILLNNLILNHIMMSLVSHKRLNIIFREHMKYEGDFI